MTQDTYDKIILILYLDTEAAFIDMFLLCSVDDCSL